MDFLKKNYLILEGEGDSEAWLLGEASAGGKMPEPDFQFLDH